MPLVSRRAPRASRRAMALSLPPRRCSMALLALLFAFSASRPYTIYSQYSRLLLGFRHGAAGSWPPRAITRRGWRYRRLDARLHRAHMPAMARRQGDRGFRRRFLGAAACRRHATTRFLVSLGSCHRLRRDARDCRGSPFHGHDCSPQMPRYSIEADERGSATRKISTRCHAYDDDDHGTKVTAALSPPITFFATARQYTSQARDAYMMFRR